jgi:hypothetical protein
VFVLVLVRTEANCTLDRIGGHESNPRPGAIRVEADELQKCL